MARVVVATPLFNKADYLPQALESLLGQSYRDFSLLLIDDGSSDGTVPIAEAYAARDPRVTFHVNGGRLGMLRNTNGAFELARRLHPEAEYFALGSDHDVWHERWLEELVAALDADPGCVLAYSRTQRIGAEGEVLDGGKPWKFDTAGMAVPRMRMQAAFERMVAGDMIYGLFRLDALERTGFYQPVLVPDRLLLSELALQGTFRQVPEVLWSRRFRGLADTERQRQAFFMDRVPLYARLPWWISHAGSFCWRYAVRGPAGPERLRAHGVLLAYDYLRLAARHRLWRRRARAIKWMRRRRKRLHPRRVLHRLIRRVARPLRKLRHRTGKLVLQLLGRWPPPPADREGG